MWYHPKYSLDDSQASLDGPTSIGTDLYYYGKTAVP